MFTFGSDPELMLISPNGELVSAIGILPEKHKAIEQNDNYFYYDNVLVELNIKVSKSKEQAISNIRNALKSLKHLINNNKFVVKASAYYPQSELNDNQALKVCQNSEWDAYSLNCNMPPIEIISKTNFRTAGGHIHLGSKQLKNNAIKKIYTVRMMDLFLGIPSLFIDNSPGSKERKKIYGKAGTHRCTNYGVEYRTLSNFWLTSPEYVGLIYDLCEFSINFVCKNQHAKFWEVHDHICFGYDAECLVKAINENNIDLANKFLTFISNYLPDKLISQIEHLSNKEVLDPYYEWNL